MKTHSRTDFSTLAVLLLFSCACAGAHIRPGLVERTLPPGAEACSLSGEPLYPPPMKIEELEKKEAQLEAARAECRRNPESADAIVWLGRRTAYLSRFNDAIRIFGEGLAKHPADARLYRHRGHRWITLRRFDRAILDLTQAAALLADKPDEIEPAGTPNARGVEIDTLKQNTFYHLALAHYLQGDFDAALPAWRECLKYSQNPDALCSVSHWMYMTLRRLHRDEEARRVLDPIRADLDVIEYAAYHRLLLAYKGEIDPDALLSETRAKGGASNDFATIGYGIGNWHLYNGRTDRALEILREVARAETWAAFGCIAAEAELARMGQTVARVPAGEDRRAIEDVLSRMARADSSGDLAAITACYTIDAELLPPGRSPIAGREAILAHYTALFERQDLSVEIHADEIEPRDGWAWCRGTTRVLATPRDGARSHENGAAPATSADQFLMILRRAREGSWAVARLMWSSRAPPVPE